MHVVITLRSFPDMLLSRWNESLKNGPNHTLDEWLQRFYGMSDSPLSEYLIRNMSLGHLVEQWAKYAGIENVTVVILDPKNKNMLFDTFEQLLDLPKSTLTEQKITGGARNRSLSAFEVEVVRRTNKRIYNSKKTSWSLYQDIVKRGAIKNISMNRRPGPDEQRAALPRWAVERSVEDGRLFAQQIKDSGVRIVGDLSHLHIQPKQFVETQDRLDESQLNLAVEALVGAFRGAEKFQKKAVEEIGRQATLRQKSEKKLKGEQKQNAQYGRIAQRMPRKARAQNAAQAFSTRDLFRALKLRLQHKLRTGKSMPLR